MKKVILAIAVLGVLASSAPAMACEGGKCTMQHSEKDGGKKKKSRKSSKNESCQMSKEASGSAATKSCCVKPEAGKTEASTAEKKAQ